MTRADEAVDAVQCAFDKVPVEDQEHLYVPGRVIFGRVQSFAEETRRHNGARGHGDSSFKRRHAKLGVGTVNGRRPPLLFLPSIDPRPLVLFTLRPFCWLAFCSSLSNVIRYEYAPDRKDNENRRDPPLSSRQHQQYSTRSKKTPVHKS